MRRVPCLRFPSHGHYVRGEGCPYCVHVLPTREQWYGTGAALDAWGRASGVRRRPGETDDDYRTRLRRLAGA